MFKLLQCLNKWQQALDNSSSCDVQTMLKHSIIQWNEFPTTNAYIKNPVSCKRIKTLNGHIKFSPNHTHQFERCLKIKCNKVYKSHARIAGIGKVNNIKAELLTLVSTGINVPLQIPQLRRRALTSQIAPAGTELLSTTPALTATMTECFLHNKLKRNKLHQTEPPTSGWFMSR